MVVGATGLALPEHASGVPVRRVTLNLPEAHGAHVGAASDNDPRDLGVYGGRVSSLRLRARHRTWCGTCLGKYLQATVNAVPRAA